MPDPGVGFEYPPTPVSWYKRDVLLFANSIGCTVDELHFLYELHPEFSVFPTYPIILPFKGTTPEILDFYAVQNSKRASIPDVPTLDSKKVVHGEQSITFLLPLPTTSEGKDFQVKAKVLGVYDKGKGTVVETENALVDGEGKVYTRMVGSSFFVGQGGWGGPKGPSTPNLTLPDRKPDAEYIHHTTLESAHLYRLNGDYNPLHATPAPGLSMGFGGAILHGLYSWNTTCHGILLTLGASDPANLKSFSARFASPVRAGDVLVTKIWRLGGVDKDGFEDVGFVTVVEGGKVCLSNGRARVRCVGKGKDEGKSKL